MEAASRLLDGRTSSLDNVKSPGRLGIEIMSEGSLADFKVVCHPDAINREARHEPPACRGRGPFAFYATALWLRQAFTDLRWDVHHVIAERDCVAVHCTMSGCHTGVFVSYAEDATVRQAFPPTGRRFVTTQTHWLRVADNQVIEHWANRDDLATAAQLGWAPPSLVYLARMAVAKRRAVAAASLESGRG